MLIASKDLKDVCSKILSAVDNSELSIITETLELKTENSCLYISVTNREYFAEVKIPLQECEEFKATVNATLFLKLISQMTTNNIELYIKDNSLVVKGNGIYNIPLIFDGEKLLELPRINIENVTQHFPIDSSILMSILNYNSKELSKGAISRPIQKLYYVDERGAITFTSGACVNSFSLPQPIKILLNNRLVKLFKLFKNEAVMFTLGYDNISDDIIQTKVSFQSDTIKLTAILSCDDTLLNSFPVEAIRGRANNTYPYSVNLNKEALIQTINRLLLFSNSYSKDTITPYGTFEFSSESVTVYDVSKKNKEVIEYTNTNLPLTEPYVAMLDLNDIKNTLETCNEQYLNLSFGDSQAMVISRGYVRNVLPECMEE